MGSNVEAQGQDKSVAFGLSHWSAMLGVNSSGKSDIAKNIASFRQSQETLYGRQIGFAITQGRK